MKRDSRLCSGEFQKSTFTSSVHLVYPWTLVGHFVIANTVVIDLSLSWLNCITETQWKSRSRLSFWRHCVRVLQNGRRPFRFFCRVLVACSIDDCVNLVDVNWSRVTFESQKWNGCIVICVSVDPTQTATPGNNSYSGWPVVVIYFAWAAVVMRTVSRR